MLKPSNYENFILLNPLVSFHAGGLMNTAVTLRNVPGLKHDSMIFDYGCGTGLTLMLLNKLKYENLIGYDTNHDFINAASFRFSQQDKKPILINDFASMNGIGKIYLVILESVFSFLDDKELEELLKKITGLKSKYDAQYLMITELFYKAEPTDDFISKAKDLYGVKKLRSKDDIKKKLAALSGIPEPVFYEIKEFINNDDPVEYPDNEAENKFLENIIGDKFKNLDEVKEYRLKYALKIKEFSKMFCEGMSYCNSIIKL